MNKNISKFQEIKILLILIKHADAKGNINFYNIQIEEELRKTIKNENWLASFLFELNEADVLHYEEIGEDGFKPITIISISRNTHEYLISLVNSVNEEFDYLEERISEILTFNPKQLSKTISETKTKLNEIDGIISNNEILKPIGKSLKEIRHHFNSVSIVFSNYESIYKNIIRPVQKEGRLGVKATVQWAIISIIISTCISLAINNWLKISQLLSGV
ncbi:hypothetical protein H2Y56_00500 [Pectobacterium aroidearum]|uniref:Uncharacterized protein n=1 Tax=Pectobacterium aroidearum TaxID=1201031 RepID=A0ABR5Z7T1_9GAMM|nr:MULTISPECIES: hypothetical protein [Pectobacterium]MBA5197803.1 hypothetical protein [Pectobacterium aroidearum]MBA5230596.1 hypothetical protein [Pectobacterium aroidearum]GKV95432.1 hypothetical protein PEC301645_28790 [Pectobacterium carotovorum subsp. carotovorum]